MLFNKLSTKTVRFCLYYFFSPIINSYNIYICNANTYHKASCNVWCGVPFGHASMLLNRTKRRLLNGGGGGRDV